MLCIIDFVNISSVKRVLPAIELTKTFEKSSFRSCLCSPGRYCAAVVSRRGCGGWQTAGQHVRGFHRDSLIGRRSWSAKRCQGGFFSGCLCFLVFAAGNAELRTCSSRNRLRRSEWDSGSEFERKPPFQFAAVYGGAQT